MIKLRTPHAVVFDLDGTLIDSRGDIAAACNHALVSHGHAPLSRELIRTFVGDGARVLLARALTAACHASSPEPGRPDLDAGLLDAALVDFHAYYQANPLVFTTLLPGAMDALDALSGIPIGLATNKPEATTLRVLDAIGIRPRFAAIAGGGEGPLKPHPFSVLSVLKKMGAEPEKAWMVGDGPQDVGAGRAAGCTTIGVLEGFVSAARLRDANPDVILASMWELRSLLG